MNTDVKLDKHFHGTDLQLAEAAARGDVAAVADLIRSGANPNTISAEGMPLLLWPVQQGNVAGTTALLANGANPNLVIPRFGSAMVLVAKLDDRRWLRLFLDHGGDPNARSADAEPLTRIAMLAGQWPSVQLLIERGAEVDASVQDVPSRTPLAFYAGSGQFEQVVWLLQHGADPTVRLEQAASAERVGAMPVLESIYWYPINAKQFPQGAQWQRKAQQWLLQNGVSEVPAEPDSMRKLRESKQLPKPLH